jgi:hypothetical protein
MAIINTILYERKIRDEFQIVVCNNITILKVLKTTLQTCQKKERHYKHNCTYQMHHIPFFAT